MSIVQEAYKINGNQFIDDLALMTVLNFPTDACFRVPRVFTISTQNDTVRGNHAHKECWQILISINSKIEVKSFFGDKEASFSLSPIHEALVVPPYNWISIESPKDSLIIVLTSQEFNELDYLRNFETYKREFAKQDQLTMKAE